MQSLDTLRLLTRGNPLMLRNMLSRLDLGLNEATLVLETADQIPLIAQVIHRTGADSAQFNYMISPHAHAETGIIILLDELIKICGGWGVRQVLADLPAESDLLPLFYRNRFRMWARQSVYKHIRVKNGSVSFSWRVWTEKDMPAMQSLHRNLVPPLFQTIEPVTRREKQGMLLYADDGRLLGYADREDGLKGIWLQPFILPEEDNPVMLLDLVNNLPETYNRPIYVAARSYQPWLGELAERAELEFHSSQILLVRQLAVRQPVAQILERPLFESGTPEGTVPAVRIQEKHSRN